MRYSVLILMSRVILAVLWQAYFHLEMLVATDMLLRRQVLLASEPGDDEELVRDINDTDVFSAFLITSWDFPNLQGAVAELVFDSAVRSHPGAFALSFPLDFLSFWASPMPSWIHRRCCLLHPVHCHIICIWRTIHFHIFIPECNFRILNSIWLQIPALLRTLWCM